MNELALSGLIIFLTSLFSVWIVARKNFYNNTNISWVLFSLSVGLWGWGLFKGFTEDSYSKALFWMRFLNLSALFIGLFFYHFVVCFVGKLKEKKRELFFYYCICLLFFVSCIVWKERFIPYVRSILKYRYYPVPALLYYIFSFIFVYLVTYGLFLLFKEFKDSKGKKREQIKYLLLGVSMGFFGGSTTFLPVFGIKIYPWGTYLVPCYVLMVTYAIVAHHLMDIYIFIKKSTIIIIGGLIPVILFFFGVLFLQDYLVERLGNIWWVIPTFVGAILLFLVYKIINYALHIKEKEIKETQVKLRKLLLNLDNVNTLKEALIYIPYYINKITGIPYCAVAFIEEDKHDIYYVIKSVRDFTNKGLRSKVKNYKFYSNDKLIEKLRHNLVLDSSKEEDSLIKEKMAYLNARYIFPCISNYQLLGFLVLGDKFPPYTEDDLELFMDLARGASIYFDKLISSENNLKLLETFKEESLKEIDHKDNYTYWHTKRVREYALLIAQNAKIRRILSKVSTGLWGLTMVAELHDIGKKCVPDEILKKQGKLSIEEYETMKNHAQKGPDVIYKFSPYLKKDIIMGIVQHHENFDGTGYPAKLKGEEIHIYGRIIKVADVFDALTSNRPYRKALSLKEALSVLIKGKGKEFDPIVVDAFLEELIGKKIQDINEEEGKRKLILVTKENIDNCINYANQI